MNALPPAGRTALWQPISAAAAKGQLVLQVCAACAAVQYPPREVCGECLSAELNWVPIDAGGTVLSWTDLHASLEPYFRQRPPWRIASIKLDCGPVVLAQYSGVECRAGERVIIANELDESGQSVFRALADNSVQ